jgi:hypothetical protein
MSVGESYLCPLCTPSLDSLLVIQLGGRTLIVDDEGSQGRGSVGLDAHELQ